MKRLLFVCFGLIVMAHAASASRGLELLHYESVIGSSSFEASGKKIDLWGIVAPDEGHLLHFTARLFLETLLAEGPLECELKDDNSYRCYVDGKDIAAGLVLFGLAEDVGGMYKLEEAEAKSNKRGLWQSPTSDEL